MLGNGDKKPIQADFFIIVQQTGVFRTLRPCKYLLEYHVLVDRMEARVEFYFYDLEPYEDK